MENNTAKHFVLQLGSLASLYLSLSFLLVLLFGLINIAIPDVADNSWDITSASQGIKIGIAMVIVFFPTYLALTRMVNKNRRLSSNHAYLGLTKWLIYLSLLVGGAVLLGDLVAVIMAFLEGDLTSRFLLKALSVLVVVGSAFQYYLLDVKGHWIENEKKSKTYGYIVGAIVIAIVGFGFTQVQSPSEARELKIDQQQINDLNTIQWQIEDYLFVNNELPESLSELSNMKLPEAPEERTEYVYERTEDGFRLCATFSQPSMQTDYYGRPYMIDKVTPTIVNPDNWEHDAGYVCFERAVK